MVQFVRRRVIGCLILALWIAGCGSEQFSPASRELMKPLQTAISARKAEWVDAAEKKIQAQYNADNISRAELDSLTAIVKKARSGEWSGAQRNLIAMIDSQRATADDMARLKEGQSVQAAAEHRKLARQSRR